MTLQQREKVVGLSLGDSVKYLLAMTQTIRDTLLDGMVDPEVFLERFRQTCLEQLMAEEQMVRNMQGDAPKEGGGVYDIDPRS